MPNIYLRLVLCALFLFNVFQVQAQERCGTMHHLKETMSRAPSMEQTRMLIEQQTIKHQASTAKSAFVITIPVVVHVVHNTAIENLSLAQIQSQIDILNEDFRRMNADAVNTPAEFLPFAADTEIQFCLATVDPDGYVTDGITRTMTNVTSFNMSGDPIMFASMGGHDIWNRDKYLNIWVGDLSGGLLGYAQFPGGAANTDGIVIDYQYFGNTGTATPPYHLGRTATHEVGHWLNLRHIWGDGSCGVDDGVSDTPLAGSSNGTGLPCTHPGPNSCVETPVDLPDMFQNFMDYSNDACMNLFTQGQKTRMRAVLENGGFRNPLLNSMGCAGNGLIPTCDDGIQNGLELGVDCGGPCPDCPEVIANCTIEDFAPALWTVEELPNMHDGSVDITNIPAMVTLNGSDNGSAMMNQSNYCITIYGTGTITFDWAYSTTDNNAVWDPFGYTINGVFTILTSNGSSAPQTGTETINVMDGDIFCLSQQTFDATFGAASTIVSNIVTPSVCIDEIYVRDPCNCLDPNNTLIDAPFLFHDVLVIESAPMQALTLTNTDGNLLTASGTPIPVGTPFTETSPGIYELDFFSVSGQAANISVGNSFVNSGFTTATCIKASCLVIEDIAINAPCACEDPENSTNLFHDVLVVEASPMQVITLTSTDGNLLTASGTPIPVGTPFIETSPGVYELDFFSVSGQAANISVGNSFVNSPFTTSTCNVANCLVIEYIRVSDPCSCENPKNITNGEQILFNDVLVVAANPMQLITLTSTDGNFLTAAETPIPIGTPLVETSPGIYELDFFTRSNQPATITVGNTAISSNFTTTACLAADCIMLIPTMSQWGLMLFGLLILNLGVLFIKYQERNIRILEQ